MAAMLVLVTVKVKADDGPKISSKVQKVIVFLNGAQVNRTATATISPGTTTLVFGNLSPDMDTQSIQVHANGNFTILSVKREMDFINVQARQKEVEELKAAQKVISDKIEMKNGLTAIYGQEENMLIKNQVVSGQNASLDVLKLQQALDFQTARLTAIKKKQQDVKNEVALFYEEIEKYNRQIADITKGNTTATSNILVTVSSKTSLQTEFTLSYVVHNAAWFPTYDIRAKDVNSPVNITYKANVSQHSGEEWKNVKLTLSTGNPSVSGSKPELSPYFLNFGMIYANQVDKITRVTGQVIDHDDAKPLVGVSVNIKGTSIGAVTDANGNYAIELPPGNQKLLFSYIGYERLERPVTSASMNAVLTPSVSSLNEVVVTGYSTESLLQGRAAGVSIRGAATLGYSTTSNDLLKSVPILVNTAVNQTNVEFNIDNPYSIPSDGKQYTVEISQLELAASYQYAVAPKLSTDVFLTARLTNWNQYNFLSGEANLFFEGTFIGKSLINTDATADTLNLSLGTDKNIVVTRTSVKELKEKQSLGANRKETRDWQLEVKNRKNQPVNLLVENQVPVSQNSAIEVETQELSGGKPDAATGKITWNLTLQPLEDKKLALRYQVRYPKNQSVIVQ